MKIKEVKDRLKNDKEFLVGSLIALYHLQEDSEKESGATAKRNNAGFNKVDSKILTDISKYYLKYKYLTDKQLRLLKPKLSKYAEQLAEIEPEPLSIGRRQEKKSKQPEKKSAVIYDEEWTKIKLTFPYDQELVHYIKSINGRKFHPKKEYGENFWTIPLTIVNVDRLLERDFEISEELNKWYSDQVHGVTNDISVPGLDNVLRPFQKEAVSYIDSRGGRSLIADEMGLGKSLEAIAWVQLHGKNVLPTVIVCPASLKLNWMKELIKFTDLGNYAEILYGFQPYKVTKPIVIVNYDILPERNEKIKSKDGKEISKPVRGTGWADYILRSFKPKLIIADEIHKAKNKDANRTKALKQLAKYTKYFIGLTGTPIDNRPKEIFEPLQMIKPTLFPNFFAFAHRYCNPKHNGFAMDYNGASNTIELNQILTREAMLRRKKEDVLKELPSKSRALVPMEIDNRKEYNDAREDLIAYLKEIDLEKAKRAKRAETLAKIATLRRLAVKGKMKQAMDWIEDFIENDKLVVFTYHQETAKQLMDRFGKRAVKIVGGMTGNQREAAKDSFQNDENVRLFIGQVTAAGEGITLTAASNAAFVEHPRTPGGLKQGEDRIHRIGQEMPVTIWNLVGNNTIDEELVNSLERKMAVMTEVIDGEEVSEDDMFDEVIDKLYTQA